MSKNLYHITIIECDCNGNDEDSMEFNLQAENTEQIETLLDTINLSYHIRYHIHEAKILNTEEAEMRIKDFFGIKD